MTSAQPADPREPASNLKLLTGLTAVGLVSAHTAFLYSPSRVVLGLVILFTLASLVAYWIARGVWFRRSWTNGELLAPGSQRSGRGWAMGVWFIPLLNLWLPRRIMLDIRHASGLPDEPGIVNLWWGASIAIFLSSVAAGFRGLHQAAVLVACALLLVKAVAFIRIIGQVTTRQVEALDLPPIAELGERAVQRG